MGYELHLRRHRLETVRSRTQLHAEAVRIIEAEYGDKLELDDIARRLATSRRQLQRAFAEIGGVSFRTHLTRVRMDVAAQLLAGDRRRSVGLVAHRVGYRQPAQFAKAFRARHGISPSEYRARAAQRAGDAPPPLDPAHRARATRLAEGGPAPAFASQAGLALKPRPMLRLS